MRKQPSIETIAKQVVAGFSTFDTKLKDFKPQVERLRDAFKDLPRDGKILGCTSFKHFCRVHLHRTPRAVFYMMAGGNPVSKRKKASGETVSPWLALYKRISPLFGESPAMLLLSKIEAPQTDEEKEAASALDNIILKLMPEFVEAYRAQRKRRAA